MNLKHILHGHAITLLEQKSTKAILSDAFNNDKPKINATPELCMIFGYLVVIN